MKSVVLSDAFIAGLHLDLGMDLQRQNLFHEAIFEYDNTLQYAPHYEKFAHWNKATSLLSLGEYEEGFREHDWGWRLFSWRGFGPVREEIDRITHLPVWDGEVASDARLLLYHELGFGDAIQTMRYLPELKRRFAHITLVINRELVRLAQEFDIEVIDHLPEDVSSFGYRLPFFGVMMALRQTLKTIPSLPYIHPREAPPLAGRDVKVGICWSGRTQHNFSLAHFLVMLEHDDFDLYSLQFGSESHEVRQLQSEDFSDTARTMAKLDHIVTIDSAVAHLAGAIGHPSTHLLLPYSMDWRWWYSEAWYPTLKTYRQESVGEWSQTFERLNEALRA